MKEKWTNKFMKIEEWQKNSATESVHMNLNLMRTEFDLESLQQEKILAEITEWMVVFWDDSDPTLLPDPLFTATQWSALYRTKFSDSKSNPISSNKA